MRSIMRCAVAVGVALVSLMPYEVSACRPFGSYAFLEDEAGGIWFTEGDNNAITRLDPDGSLKSYPIPTEAAEVADLAFDKEGNVWFVEMYGNRIGKLAKDGRITEFDVPTMHAHPARIAVDAHNNVWFTEENKIGRLTESLTVVEYPLEKGWPTAIAVDKEDNLWVAMLEPSADKTDWSRNTGRIRVLMKDGKWREKLARQGSCPMNLTLDAAGGMWFSDRCRSSVERMDADGKLTAVAISKDAFVQDMAVDGTGIVWFVDSLRNKMGKITRDGRVEEFPPPGDNGGPFALALTRRGDLYFSETYNYNINRLTKEGVFEEHLVNVDYRQKVNSVKEGEVCYLEFASKVADKAKLERKRIAEFKVNRFKETQDGVSKLAEQRCLPCHDVKRILASRKSNWLYSINRMQDYMGIRDVPLLTDKEKEVLVRYFNTHYGINQ